VGMMSTAAPSSAFACNGSCFVQASAGPAMAMPSSVYSESRSPGARSWWSGAGGQTEARRGFLLAWFFVGAMTRDLAAYRGIDVGPAGLKLRDTNYGGPSGCASTEHSIRSSRDFQGRTEWGARRQA
jgi:hypothetical protein